MLTLCAIELVAALTAQHADAGCTAQCPAAPHKAAFALPVKKMSRAETECGASLITERGVGDSPRTGKWDPLRRRGVMVWPMV